MIKILLIIPDRELRERVKQTEKYLSLLNIPEISIESAYKYGTDNAMIGSCNADIVIARGLTGQAIKRSFPNIHLVEIAVTSDDIIHALLDARRQNGNAEVALILPNTNTCRVHQLEEITGIPIRPYYISEESGIHAAIEDAISRGIKSIIGGGTVCQYCTQRGLSAIKIHSGEAAIERAINEAINTAKSLNLERTKSNLLRTLLNNNRDAILAVDASGMVIVMNLQAQRLFDIQLHLNQQILIGALLHDNDVRKIMNATDQSEQVITIKGKLMLVRRSPITIDSEELGVILTLQNAEEISAAEALIRNQLRIRGLIARFRFSDILAANTEMRQRIETAEKYSKVESSVLILGETGTGKEMFAQSIHNDSRRCNHPFVAINCAALPEQLLESELFGYTEGSFSGASKEGKAGLFQQAHKGTIFLDEIGEMPITLQAKLLRVLEQREIRRIGDNKVIPVDIRIICATNINIFEKLKNNQFRSDLFYRINTLSMHIPPLRKRPEDVRLLFQSFVEKYAQTANRKTPKITEDAFIQLQAYPWPGNVRELKNFSERIVLLGEDHVIDRNAIESAMLFQGIALERTESPESRKLGNDAISEEELAFMMYSSSNLTRSELAARLGISRTTLWRKLKSDKQ